MPKGDRLHPGYRTAALRERHRLFPELELTPDLSRGMIRLVGEVVLWQIAGHQPPAEVLDQALSIATIMANG